MPITRRAALATAAGMIAGAVGVPAFGVGRSIAGNIIIVRAPKGSTVGKLRFRGRKYPCALGRSGIVFPKREGDGGTPVGRFRLREVCYRADRVAPPKTGLRTFRIHRTDGWCDDPADPSYNRLVRMPYQGNAEPLWRRDHAYDVFAVIGYNDSPPVPGAGSAIFLHVARRNSEGLFLPTAGCVALKEKDLLAVLAACRLGTLIDIRAA